MSVHNCGWLTSGSQLRPPFPFELAAYPGESGTLHEARLGPVMQAHISAAIWRLAFVFP